MRVCDVAVIGLGIMGSAAVHALVRQKADVLGFDPLEVGEPRGSSHGSCRVFRRFNFENPAYDDLSEEALAGWRALEAGSGRSILKPCPVLEACPPDRDTVRRLLEAAKKEGKGVTAINSAAANAAFPAFQLPPDWDVSVQDGGILLIEAAMHTFRERARGRIIAQKASVRPTGAGILVTTTDEVFLAGQAIVAAGPWIGDFIPGLSSHLTVTRQAVGWFKPTGSQPVGYGKLPIFALDGPHGFVYGFPDFEGRGVKAASHVHGPVVRSDEWDHVPTDEELSTAQATLKDFIPAAAGPIVGREVCLYTNTSKADFRTDDGEEFIIDRLPRDPRIIVASPCSGHGAKFATAIGEMLAKLALDPTFRTKPAFWLDRYSTFATA